MRKPTAPIPPSRHLVSLDEAATYTGCSTRTLRRLIAAGSLTGYRLGPRLIRVDVVELEAQVLRPIPAGSGAAGAR
ncbi:MAG: helix-turn-helix transcriptional regulator [Actinomycetes bacterium]